MTADELVALFDLKPKGEDRFVGLSPLNGWKRVYGGQVLAQALVAAQRTVLAAIRTRCTPISCSAATRTSRSCSRWSV